MSRQTITTSVQICLCLVVLLSWPNAGEGDGFKLVVVKLPVLQEKHKPLDGNVLVSVTTPPDQITFLVEHPSIFRAVVKPTSLRQDSTSGQIHLEDDPDRKILLDFTQAFRQRLEETTRGIFPQTILSEEEGKSRQLYLSAELMLRALPLVDPSLSAPPGSAKGMQATIKLKIENAAGGIVDQIEVAGVGLPGKDEYWSLASGWNDIASRCLTRAFNDLGERIRTSQPLRDFLKGLAEQRALPAGLSTVARFDDSASLLPGGRLDAGEEAQLLVEVSNQGPGTAYGVVVQGMSQDPQVTVVGGGSLGDIAPGQKHEAALKVAGSLNLTSGLVKLRIDTSEKRGYGARPVLLEVAGEQIVRPRLEIADITLNDRSGRAEGDGDGQPGNGETIEAVVRVRNAGSGEAAAVAVTVASPKGTAEILEPKVVVPRIAANGVGEARLLFRLPINIQASELSLAFQAVDARGPQVAAIAKEQTWKVRTKRPGIELAYRLYDGGSVGSAGNRDGKVNNGERIEVAVTPANRGDLPARGVRIAVESEDPKLVPRPAVLEVGDLPAQAEGPALRFVFDVPRGFGLDRPQGDLHFSLNISQQDFPVRKEPVSLGFQALRPDLSLEANAPASLGRGTGGEMVLRLRNIGPIRAEEVTVEVASDVSGVDLLDERGVPVRSRKIAVGSLDPGSAAPGSSLRINVRRNAAVGPAPVRMTVSQKDFPPTSRTVQVAVTEEAASVIAAPRPEEPVARPAPGPAPAAATISFLQNTPGQHLTAEAVVLRFEVQSPAELAEVRLTQNERLLPLEGARRTASLAGGMQAVQYELPVQLAEGENRFEVVTVTRQGLRSARSLSLIRDREVGRIWVVAFGVSRYQEPAIPGLGYADADARAVADYFRETFTLPADQIFLRTNEQATLREIKSILGTQLAAQANDPRDTVILYFAGHGMRDRVTGSLDPDGLSKYFLPYDTSRGDLYSTALDMEEVGKILRRLVPERVVVLLDSCFSGAAGGRSPFDPKAEGERALISSEFLDRMVHNGKGRVVLTASGPDESAQESADFGHGVFTYFLLEGLRGAADLNGDGEIDVHEVYGYISEKVGRATHGRQNPKLKEPDLVGQILIGRGAVRKRR